ncbi:MAG: hypothetical protein WC822_01370 [Candidatus Paceibacterota bacterium]|jgi:hypothetical protein
MATRYQIEIRLIATSGPGADLAKGIGTHTAYVRTHETANPDEIYEAMAMVDWLAQTDVERRMETTDCPGCPSVLGTDDCECIITYPMNLSGQYQRVCGVCLSPVNWLGRCGTFETVRK